MKNTEHRMDSLGQRVQSVSVYEKGIILQSHKREGGFIQRAMAILRSITVQLHEKIVINVYHLQRAW